MNTHLSTDAVSDVLTNKEWLKILISLHQVKTVYTAYFYGYYLAEKIHWLILTISILRNVVLTLSPRSVTAAADHLINNGPLPKANFGKLWTLSRLLKLNQDKCWSAWFNNKERILRLSSLPGYWRPRALEKDTVSERWRSRLQNGDGCTNIIVVD